MTLARARESTHPLDAVPIYERAVAAQIETKKNGGYRAAADLLSRIRTLTANAGTATIRRPPGRPRRGARTQTQSHGPHREEGLDLTKSHPG